jgi:ribosomal protein S19
MDLKNKSGSRNKNNQSEQIKTHSVRINIVEKTVLKKLLMHKGYVHHCAIPFNEAN